MAKRRNISSPLSTDAVRFALYGGTSLGWAQQNFWSGAAALTRVHGCGSARNRPSAAAGGARESTHMACVIAAGTGSTERASRLMGGSHAVCSAPLRASTSCSETSAATSRTQSGGSSSVPAAGMKSARHVVGGSTPSVPAAHSRVPGSGPPCGRPCA